jgi:hypothetical protein
MSSSDATFVRKALERLYGAITKTNVEALQEALAYAAMALDVKADAEPSNLMGLGSQILIGAYHEHQATVLRISDNTSDDGSVHIFITDDDVVAALLDNSIDENKWGEA